MGIDNLTADRLAEVMCDARVRADKSQRYMAKAMGKSVGTIQNWEAGYSVPSVLELIRWYEILGINPLHDFLDVLHPSEFRDVELKGTNKEIRQSLIKYVSDIASESEVKKIAFCCLGRTGSSWQAQLDELVAINHLPIRDRLDLAGQVCSRYDFYEHVGELCATDRVSPDMEHLRSAIDRSKDAIYNGKVK